MRFVDLDLAGIHDACATGDAARFAELVAPLGVDLTLPALAAYIARFDEVVTVRTVLADLTMRALHQALTEPHGFALVRSDAVWYVALAVRVDERVVVGVAPSPRPTHHGWASIDRWFKEPARNRPTAMRWATDAARAGDAMSVALREPAAAPPVGNREEDLLAAVLADPAADDARLVYADALLERGDARGELIRLQCELARGDVRDPRRRDIASRALELLAVCGPAIASSVFGVPHEVRRGLVESIRVTPAQLARHGAAIFAAHPIRRVAIATDRLGLSTLANVVAKGFALPKQVEQLTVIGHEGSGRTPRPAHLDLGAPALRALCAAVPTVRFEHVLTDLWTSWTKLLADLPHVTALHLDHCHTHPQTVEALASPELLPRLAALSIKSLDLVSLEARRILDHARRLGERATLAAVELSLWDQGGIPDRIVEALLLGHHLAELRVGACRLTDATASTLAASSRSRSLRTLDIPSFSALTLAGLVRSPNLASLAELHLRLGKLTPGEATLLGEALAAAPALRRVHSPQVPRATRDLAPNIEFVDRDPRDGNLYVLVD